MTEFDVIRTTKDHWSYRDDEIHAGGIRREHFIPAGSVGTIVMTYGDPGPEAFCVEFTEPQCVTTVFVKDMEKVPEEEIVTNITPLDFAAGDEFVINDIAREIATNHIVGRAFCWVGTDLIVRLRTALGIEPYARPEVNASYVAELKKRGLDG